jgi:hypothetical protein
MRPARTDTRLSCTSYYENSPSKKFFSYELLHARKGEIWVPTSYLQDSPSSFLSYESLKTWKRRIFLPTSYIQGQEVQEAKEAMESAKVVCCHKEGTWKKKKKEKKKTKEGENVAPP